MADYRSGSGALADVRARVCCLVAVLIPFLWANPAAAQQSSVPVQYGDYETENDFEPSFDESADYFDSAAHHDYSWYQSVCNDLHCWTQDWHGGFDFGLNGAGGNSQYTTIVSVLEAKREVGSTSQSLDANYFFTSADSTTSANNLYARFRNEVALADSNAKWFVDVWYQHMQGSDSFLGVNTGIGIDALDNGTTKFTPRIGLGAPDLYLGLDFEHQVTSCTRVFATIDYYPNFDFDEYRLNTYAGWELLLDYDSGLNMKIAAWDRYNGTRNSGNRPNDIVYLMMIGCQF